VDLATSSIGVEEEFFVVDAETGRLRPDGREVIDGAHHFEDDQLDVELSRSQVESGTAVCRDLDELHLSLTSLRRRLRVAADDVGCRIMASGTHPFAHWSEDGGVSAKDEYRYLESMYGQLTDEQVVCGCHIHVGVDDPELAIQIMNRARVYLPLFVALGANSPFWLGDDTRYASYRTQIFHRWPTSGIPEEFSSRAEYDELVALMHHTKTIDQPARIYWDLRPSVRYPTLEFRACDVQVSVEHSVALAGLALALVETCGDASRREESTDPMRPELLRAALWRASRFGLDETLLDVVDRRSSPADEVIRSFLGLLRPALEARDHWDRVSQTVDELLGGGGGARQQRAAYRRRGEIGDVVDVVVDHAITA